MCHSLSLQKNANEVSRIAMQPEGLKKSSCLETLDSMESSCFNFVKYRGMRMLMKGEAKSNRNQQPI